MPAVGIPRFALVAFAATCATARAQNPPLPDTGRIHEELRVPEPPRAKPAPSIRIESPRFEAVKPTPPFYVARFTISGETAFNEARLLELVGEPRRELTLAQVQELAERITQFYRDHGYIVARALIPAQDVRDGVVRIQVVEGRYGRVDIANATEMSEALIRRILGGVKEGALVHGPTLERAVLLLADRAGIQPRATLEPGEEPGTTNLTLEIAPGPTTEFDALIDNGGARATGRTRVTGDAVLDSPRNVGDRLSARGITSGNGLLSGRIAYETPLGVSGLTGVAYVTQTTYQLGAPFEALDATGTARTLGGSLSYPLVRSSAWNLRLQAGLEGRELEDKIGALSQVNKRNASVLQWGASADARDKLLSGAISSAQFLVTNGELDLKSASAAALDAATARTGGSYAKLAYGVSRLQALGERSRLSLTLTGQRAFDNLDSSEKFALGGLNGVRAYPVGEAAGDDVQLFQGELHILGPQIGPGQLVPLVFLDWAHSRINHQPWAGFTGTNDRHLWGYGLGAEWSMKGKLFARLWYARKGGDEPATADTDRRDRLWGQAGVLF